MGVHFGSLPTVVMPYVRHPAGVNYHILPQPRTAPGGTVTRRHPLGCTSNHWE
ncbi:hypothetical protein BD779DRAFT_1565385 [Infundibulicybe gibba]|nr:hypothetical protein BD779DRAFT_1565385 [Infundibulicybe gibba]